MTPDSLKVGISIEFENNDLIVTLLIKCSKMEKVYYLIYFLKKNLYLQNVYMNDNKKECCGKGN